MDTRESPVVLASCLHCDLFSPGPRPLWCLPLPPGIPGASPPAPSLWDPVCHVPRAMQARHVRGVTPWCGTFPRPSQVLALW